MVEQWDNIEILQVIDRYQQETYRGGPLTGVNGLQLMERVAGSMVVDQPLWHGFVKNST